MVKVRQVATEEPEQEEPVKKVRKVVKPVRQVVGQEGDWIPPEADKWKPPFHPLPLCAWVPPSLRHKLPDTPKGWCEANPCPCKAAERYAVEHPSNIFKSGDR